VILEYDMIRDLVDTLFGYDVFISYKTAEANSFAAALYEALSRRESPFACFLDRTELPAGAVLNEELKRAIEKTRCFLLLVTPNALNAKWVRLELDHRLKTGGAIVAINFDGAVESALESGDVLAERLAERSLIQVGSDALIAGPDDEIIGHLLRHFDFRRQETLRAQLVAVGSLMFALLVAIAFDAWRETEKQIVLRDAASREAASQQRVSRAQGLATQSRAVRRYSPRRSTTIALAAASVRQPDDPDVPVVEQELRDSLLVCGGLGLPCVDGLVEPAPVMFSPDGRYLLTGSAVGPRGHAVMPIQWDLTADSPATVRKTANLSLIRTICAGFTPDNKWLVIAGSRTYDDIISICRRLPDGAIGEPDIYTIDDLKGEPVAADDGSVWSIHQGRDGHGLYRWVSNSRTVCLLGDFGAQSGVRRVLLGRWGWCDWL